MIVDGWSASRDLLRRRPGRRPGSRIAAGRSAGRGRTATTCEAAADAGEREPALGVGGDGLRPGTQARGRAGPDVAAAGAWGCRSARRRAGGDSLYDALEPDLDPGGRLTADVDQPAADDLLGLEVDLGRGLLGIGMELHAAEGGAGPGGAGQGVDVGGTGTTRRGPPRCGSGRRRRPRPGRARRKALAPRRYPPSACGTTAMMSTGAPAAGRPSGPSTRPVTVIRAAVAGIGLRLRAGPIRPAVRAARAVEATAPSRAPPSSPASRRGSRRRWRGWR